MTQSHSDMKDMYTEITDLWKICKTRLEHPPETIEDWQRFHADLYAYSGRDEFKCEMAAACYRKLSKMYGGVPA